MTSIQADSLLQPLAFIVRPFLALLPAFLDRAFKGEL